MDDDDGIVEDDVGDEENAGGAQFRPPLLRNQDPAFLGSSFNMVAAFLQSYGWYIVIIAVILIYFREKIKEIFSSWQQSRTENIDLHRYDNSEVQRRHEAMEEARRRMQERYAQDAERFKEEQIKKEDEKRKERLEDWERHQEGKGYRSKQRNIETNSQKPEAKPQNVPKTRIYRPDDYNPLTGGSSGSNYRPPQRRGGGG